MYCGKKVIQDQDGIKVTQHDAAMAIQYADIEPRRRKQPSLTLSAEEKTELRRIIGAIGWLARQTRYDLLVDNSMLAQRTGNPVISDLVDANKLVKRCQEYAHHALVFKANIGIEYGNKGMLIVAQTLPSATLMTRNMARRPAIRAAM